MVPFCATVDSTENNYLETACIGMAGTHCVSGSATGVVIATGDGSVLVESVQFLNVLTLVVLFKFD